MPEGIVHYIQNNSFGITFTVNIPFGSVPILKTGLPQIGETSALQYFTLGESVAILSSNVVLPYQFGQAGTGPAKIVLGWVDKNGHAGPLYNFGSGGQLAVPDFNQEHNINNFIETPATADSPWGLRITSVSGLVNMFNTPAALDATIQNVRIFLKIRHFFNMVS